MSTATKTLDDLCQQGQLDPILLGEERDLLTATWSDLGWLDYGDFTTDAQHFILDREQNSLGDDPTSAARFIADETWDYSDLNDRARATIDADLLEGFREQGWVA